MLPALCVADFDSVVASASACSRHSGEEVDKRGCESHTIVCRRMARRSQALLDAL